MFFVKEILKSKIILVFLFSILCHPVTAQTTIEKPLAGLPSKPGPTIEAIIAMKNNTWLSLGVPTPDPKWGSALGCSWGGRSFVSVPDLRGAFRVGEGRHAFVKENGFVQDDYWFYDINANKWICLYPGTDTKGFNDAVESGKIKVDDNGSVVDKTGQAIPGHILTHAWGFVSYDTDLKKISWTGNQINFHRYFMGGIEAIGKGLTALEGKGLNKPGVFFCPWAYDCAKGVFEHEVSKEATPVTKGFPLYIYVPSKKEFFLASEYGAAFFNPAKRSWRVVADPGKLPGSIEFNGCLDTKRNRVYMGTTFDNFFYFDLQTEKFIKIENPKGSKVDFSNNEGAVNYDTTNDVVLIFSNLLNNSISNVFVFDPEKNVVRDVLSFDEKYVSTKFETNGVFYDQELGVHFIYTSNDSNSGGVMWVYKYGDASVKK